MTSDTMMKGNKVVIFEDPITEKIREGLATLKRKGEPCNLPIKRGEHLEYWYVVFDGQPEDEYLRCMRVLETTGRTISI